MKYFIFLFIYIGIFSCKKESIKAQNSKQVSKKSIKNTKYANGFELIFSKNYNKIILNPSSEKEKHIYILKSKDSSIKKEKNVIIFQQPIKRIVVTSTTHIPMLELLGETDALIGFPNSKYISSKKTRKRIAKGKVTELGKEQSINTELLINLKPDAVIGFSMGNNNKTFENIKKAGIPVIINNDWLEKSPLGRAEWIKFFGALFNKSHKADSIFNSIEKKYLQAKKIALNAKNRPKVLSGVLYKDKWNLPAGKSYVAQFLKDANVNYPWQNTTGTGSLSLAFESVFNKGKDAQFWIAPGYYQSYSQLEKANQHYKKFDAFKNKKIYNFTKKKGKTGGILYYELAPIQPDVVLKDIIKVTHPELLKGYQPFYLENLNY
ncbi:MAG TPA: ABC transporter substrate-binding protein [Flavobacteriia bacterium]|nr:ABC transporter substrate-binding protein [Flavobacteriia bacterium]